MVRDEGDEYEKVFTETKVRRIIDKEVVTIN